MDINDLIQLLENDIVRHVVGNKSLYDNLTTKEDNTLYFITDEGSIYKGDKRFGGQKGTLVLKGMLGKEQDGGTLTSLPTSNYEKGWTYIVVSDVVSENITLNKGDIIIAKKDYDPKSGASLNLGDWVIIKASDENAITSENTLTQNNLILGDGDKKVKTFENGSNNQVLSIENNALKWKTPNTLTKKLDSSAGALTWVHAMTCNSGNSCRLSIHAQYNENGSWINQSIVLDLRFEDNKFYYTIYNDNIGGVTKIRWWVKDSSNIIDLYCNEKLMIIDAVLESLHTAGLSLNLNPLSAEEINNLRNTGYRDTEYTLKNGIDSNLDFLGNAATATESATADKVKNKLTIGNVEYDGSSAVNISASDLGITGAMRYVGITSTVLEDGSTQQTIVINNENYTANAGDVVHTSKEKEFLWNGTEWEELGSEGSFKKKQTAVLDPSSSGDSTDYSFISSISQDAEGVITPTKKKIPTAGTNKLGMVKTTDSRTSVPQGYEAVPIVGGVPYVNTAYLPTRGGTMAGDINMNGNKMTNVSIEPVDSLPTENLYEGRQVTYQGRIYTYHNNEWLSVADDLGGRPETHPEEFLYQPTAADLSIKDGFAKIKSIKGNTIVWNQLADVAAWLADKNFVIGFSNTNFVDGILTLSTTTATTYKRIGAYCNTYIKGHKILFSCQAKCNIANYTVTDYGLGFRAGLNSAEGQYMSLKGMGSAWKKFSSIISMHSTADYRALGLVLNVSEAQLAEAGGTLTFEFKNIKVFDLTQMFGEGNEPATVEEFEAMFPASNYEYNAGELLSHDSTGIKTVGFNQWDEEWEKGSIDSNGELNNDGFWRCKNPIKVIPNTTYCFKSTKALFIYWYDGDYKLIGTGVNSTTNNRLHTSPANARYLRFYEYEGTSYNNDICINLSHTGVRNGEYQPYEEYVNKWSGSKKISELTSNGEVVFPNGLMGGAGDAYDEITKDAQGRSIAIKRVTIAEDRLSLQSLATPVTYVLDDDISFEYKVWDFGTEEAIVDGLTSAFKADIEYGFNAVDMIRNNYFEIGNIKKSYLPVNGTAFDSQRLQGYGVTDEIPNEPEEGKGELVKIPTHVAVRDAIIGIAAEILNLLTWGNLDNNES